MIESTYLILLVHGPNLNLLGERNPEVYGNTSLAEIESNVLNEAKKRGAEIKTFQHRIKKCPDEIQSNHEGGLIDFLHENRTLANGVLINPGGLTHTSVALRDAIEAINIPTIEVHLSDITAREDFRKVSLIADVCIDQVAGQGPEGYTKAVNLLIDDLER